MTSQREYSEVRVLLEKAGLADSDLERAINGVLVLMDAFGEDRYDEGFSSGYDYGYEVGYDNAVDNASYY